MTVKTYSVKLDAKGKPVMQWKDAEPICPHCKSKGDLVVRKGKAYRCRICESEWESGMQPVLVEHDWADTIDWAKNQGQYEKYKKGEL